MIQKVLFEQRSSKSSSRRLGIPIWFIFRSPVFLFLDLQVRLTLEVSTGSLQVPGRTWQKDQWTSQNTKENNFKTHEGHCLEWEMDWAGFKQGEERNAISFWKPGEGTQTRFLFVYSSILAKFRSFAFMAFLCFAFEAIFQFLLENFRFGWIAHFCPKFPQGQLFCLFGYFFGQQTAEFWPKF